MSTAASRGRAPFRLALGLLVSASAPFFTGAAAPPDVAPTPAPGILHVRVLDHATGQPVACTVALVDATGRLVTEGEGFRGGFRSTGLFTKTLPPGQARLRITRGPEYLAAERKMEIPSGEAVTVEVELARQVDLRRRGWFSGDSHVHMLHGERTVPVDFDQVSLAARAEDLQYLSLAQAWQLDDPTPERLEAELARRSTADGVLTWNLEAPKNYYLGDAGRCLGHCWTLGMRGRTAEGGDVIAQLLEASAWDYESQKPSFANFESHALIRAQGGAVFYTHPARWWTGSWGGRGGYPLRAQMRVSNMAVELPLDTLIGPTYDGLDVLTSAGEHAANDQAFQLWSLLLNHGYRLAATASSDACFDRPGGATPGAARLYTHIAGPFSVASAAEATAKGRTFATTGPLLLVSLDGQPPGSAHRADGRPHDLAIEAWSSGATTGGLARVEVLRSGQLFREFALTGDPTAFRTNLAVTATEPAWFCVRAFGSNRQGQRAVSGAFYLDPTPWRPPDPVAATVRVRVVGADSGKPLDATITEVTYEATQPRVGQPHRLPGGDGVLRIPATRRLRAEATGHAPVTLSPFFDSPALVEAITGLEGPDLLDWATFERLRTLLGEVELTFRLPRPQSQ